MAIAAGIKATRTVAREENIAEAAQLIRQGNGTSFVLLRVKPSEPPAYKRLMDPAACRVRFRMGLLGQP
jgi:phosphonopyruvate decarboxylase